MLLLANSLKRVNELAPGGCIVPSTFSFYQKKLYIKKLLNMHVGGGGKYIMTATQKNIQIIAQILFSVFTGFGGKSVVSQIKYRSNL